MPLTDFCNRHFRLEHPTSIARLPSPQPLTAAATASPQRAQSPSYLHTKGPKHLGEHGVGPPFGNPAPGKAALDDAARASAQSLTFLPHVMEEKMGPARRQGHLGPAFSAKREAEDQTSDAPVALRASPGQARFFTKSLGPLPPPLRQQERLSRPGSAFHRHVRRSHSQASPATDPAALPPRSGFRRSFAPSMLSHERARSSSIARAIRPGSRGPRAACRLLQSKRSLSTTA